MLRGVCVDRIGSLSLPPFGEDGDKLGGQAVEFFRMWESYDLGIKKIVSSFSSVLD